MRGLRKLGSRVNKYFQRFSEYTSTMRVGWLHLTPVCGLGASVSVQYTIGV